MSQFHITKDGKCTYCGSKLSQCCECGEWFISTRKDHVYCRDRCRTRASRRKNKFEATGYSGNLSELIHNQGNDMPEQETPVKPPVQPDSQPPKPDDDK